MTKNKGIRDSFPYNQRTVTFFGYELSNSVIDSIRSYYCHSIFFISIDELYIFFQIILRSRLVLFTPAIRHDLISEGILIVTFN